MNCPKTSHSSIFWIMLTLLLGTLNLAWSENKCTGIAGWVDQNYPGNTKVTYNNHLWVSVSGGAYKGWTPGRAVSNMSPQWNDLGICIDLRLNLDSTTLSKYSQSTNSSSSTQIRNTPNWNKDSRRTTRCDLDGQQKSSGERQCFDPSLLQGAQITLPYNVTRISKNMITLCNLKTEKAQPLAVVYVWDNSGSMSNPDLIKKGEANDPDSIAPKALSQALDAHLELDSLGRAGFVKFGTTIYDTISPIRLGLDSNLAQLKEWMQYTDAGGTSYDKALRKARDYLAAKHLDGYRKVIILVSDGLPQDNMVVLNTLDSARKGLSPNFPEIHSVFLNRDSASRDSGAAYLRKIALYSSVDSTHPPTVTPITKAEDMADVIKGLLTKLIEKKSPTSMEMKHLGLGTSIFANANQLVMQADSSWNIPLDTTLSLIPGQNKISFTTHYGQGTSDSTTNSVEFTINIDSSIVNQPISIEGTPFRTTCYEPNSIYILDQNQTKISALQQRDTLLYIEFSTIETQGFGDSVEIILKTKSMDSLSVKLGKTSNSNQGTTYRSNHSTQWIIDSSDQGTIKLGAIDTIFAKWIHPTDPRDGAANIVPVLLPVPQPQGGIALDENADGWMDHLCLDFSAKLEPWMIDALNLRWSYPINNKDTAFALIPNGQSTLTDSTLCWSPSKLKFDRGTALNHSSGQVTAYQGITDQGKVKDSVLVKIRDGMPPLLDTARISYKDKARTQADLVLIFSEGIAKDSIQQNPAFNFWTKKQFMENLSHPNGRWSSEKTLRIPMSFEKDTGFQIFPNDSIQMKSISGGIIDQTGLRPRPNGALTPVFGELPFRIKAPGFIATNFGNLNPQEPVTYRVIRDDEDGIQTLEKEGIPGFVFGPLRMDTNAMENNGLYDWKIEIYDISGQYVNSLNGNIDCQSKDLYELCTRDQGAQFLFQWNAKAEGGRNVGTGVYLWRITMMGTERMIKMGLQRRR